jgi:NAD(P)-dependent dehydrogenase (short-subunit alcohol dehydrogenase family)
MSTSPADNRLNFGLAGRVIVITGAGQGIGAACAERLAAEGAAVALWDVNLPAAQGLAQRLRESGARVEAMPCNVSRKADVDAALAATVLAFGRIDGLVNNAGIFRAADFLEVTEEDWDAVLDVNLKGAFLAGQAVARQMVAQGGGGAIVNMSSVNGSMAIASIASYNASKGGINQLTRAMALALADHRIRVNAAAPGTIATELAREAVLTSDEARLRILGRTPMKRLGEPEEVADVVAFLLSDAARYMTGEIVHVDGGRMALNYTVPVAPPPVA